MDMGTHLRMVTNEIGGGGAVPSLRPTSWWRDALFDTGENLLVFFLQGIVDGQPKVPAL